MHIHLSAGPRERTILLRRYGLVPHMARSDKQSEVLNDLAESLRGDADIVFAAVFGSHVRGGGHAASDIDLAVKFTDDLSSHERFQKQCFLSGTLQREDGPFVDVSDIENLPVKVAHDAVNGELLCGDQESFERVRERIESSFEDEQDDLRRRHRDVIEGIAEDGLRG
jgi:predicted nucleotidyltransferase